VIVVALSTVAGVGLLRRAFDPERTQVGAETSSSAEASPASSASTTPMPAPSMVPGLSTPICVASAVEGEFGTPQLGTWLVATIATADAGCPAPGGGSGIVALDADGDGAVDTSVRIDCSTPCVAMAAPDVDGDGLSDLMVAVDKSHGATQFELFTSLESGIEMLRFACAECRPPTFSWGGPTDNRSGAYCLSSHDGPDFVTWTASPNDDGTRYEIIETTVDVTGTVLQVVDQTTSTVPLDPSALPPGGGDRFCGETVRVPPP
jgi:hypothetical protein